MKHISYAWRLGNGNIAVAQTVEKNIISMDHNDHGTHSLNRYNGITFDPGKILVDLFQLSYIGGQMIHLGPIELGFSSSTPEKSAPGFLIHHPKAANI